MPEWVNKTIKHNPGEKSLKKPFVIYLDLECILKKLQSYNNNNNNNNIGELYTAKKARHEPSGWAMFKKCSFDKKENKIRGKDCIEKFCNKLKESAMEVINCEKKQMIP